MKEALYIINRDGQLNLIIPWAIALMAWLVRFSWHPMGFAQARREQWMIVLVILLVLAVDTARKIVTVLVGGLEALPRAT